MSNDVKHQRAEYTNMLASMEKNRLAVSGQRAVRAAGTKCLAPLASMLCSTNYDQSSGVTSVSYSAIMTSEGLAKYNKYLNNAYFFGASGITVSGMSGLISAKKPVKNLPASVEYLNDNANGKGQGLRDFTTDAVNEAFTTVRSGILVARPSTPAGASELDVEQQNLRPKLLHYKFESIINWDYTTVNNEEKLSLLVLVEQTTERKGFEVETVNQYRVLELVENVYHQSLYDEDGNIVNEPAPVIVNGSTTNEIPFYWIVAETQTKAVIDDLVDANYEHYNIYADYGSKLHYSSFIIYTETGVQNGNSTNVIIGNGVKWNGSDNASFGILQPDGNADSHRLALQDTETRMAALGADMLKPRTSGAESAEAKSLDKVAQNSTTANVAITVSGAITQAINFASRWMGGTEDTEYMLNTDYNPTGMDANMLNALWATTLAGGMSYQTFYENIQRGEIANTERTADEEQALIVVAETGME